MSFQIRRGQHWLDFESADEVAAAIRAGLILADDEIVGPDGEAPHRVGDHAFFGPVFAQAASKNQAGIGTRLKTLAGRTSDRLRRVPQWLVGVVALVALLVAIIGSVMTRPPPFPSSEKPYAVRIRSYRHFGDAQRYAREFERAKAVEDVYVVGRRTKADGVWFDVQAGTFDEEEEATDALAMITAAGIASAAVADYRAYDETVIPDLEPFRAAPTYDTSSYFEDEPTLWRLLQTLPNSTRFSLRFLWTLYPSRKFGFPRGLRRIMEHEETELAAALVDPFMEMLKPSMGVGAAVQYLDQFTGDRTDVFLFLPHPAEPMLAADTVAEAKVLLCPPRDPPPTDDPTTPIADSDDDDGRDALAPGPSSCTSAPVSRHFRGRDYSGVQVTIVGKPPVTVLAAPNGDELWAMRDLPTDGHVSGGLLGQSLGKQGVIEYEELKRAINVLPERFTSQGELLASFHIVQVGARYIQAKRDAEWARLMRGHWASSFYLIDQEPSPDEKGQAEWSIDVFDFKDDDVALRAHNNRYDKILRQAHSSFANKWSKAYRGDAIYKTELQDTGAWYIDLYRIARLKELNFVRDGFIYAVDSYVMTDRKILLMDDLKGRALALPTFGRARRIIATEVGPMFLD